MSRPLLVLNAATLSPAAIKAHAPNLQRLAAEGTLRPLTAPFPSLSCSSHATMLTGLPPQEHGMVGNGWYDRAFAKTFMWNRSSHLVAGETLWDAARKREPGLRCANLFWRQCADSTCNIIVTERPVYWSSGRKAFDFYTWPAALHRPLRIALGPFPFPQFWGPLAGIQSTTWILNAALELMRSERPELLLVYAPYLDYDAERYGADSETARAAVRRFDTAAAPLIEAARAEGRDVAVVSDYGWDVAERPVYLNRALRDAGLLDVVTAANGEQLQPGTSRAFAVVDSQIAHVYVPDPADLPTVRSLLEGLDGVAEVLDEEGKRRHRIAHPRSGDLIAIAKPRHWFAYPYWQDARAEPDVRHCVAVFDKNGWDPTELFLRPGVLGRLRLGVRMLQKLLRLAVPFDPCAGDERMVGGTRAARNDDPEQGAVLLTSWPLPDGEGPLAMEQLKAILLARMFEASGAMRG